MLAERHALIYRFDRWKTDARAVGQGGEVVEIAGHDGTPIAVWTVPPRDGMPLVLHFGGNVGVLRRAVSRMRPLVEAGYGAAVMNYRGAGGMPGAPSQADIVADALAVHDALAEDAPPVIYGTSLGAAVAVELAARREARALVLAAPFAQLCTVAEHHHPWVPACLVMWDERWDSVDRIGGVAAPVLILHGARDRIVPVAEAERLAEAAGEGARLVVYPGAAHRDLARHGAVAEVLRFLEGR
jgi:alpha-beta hydrolase superfamily lysophospholipase